MAMNAKRRCKLLACLLCFVQTQVLGQGLRNLLHLQCSNACGVHAYKHFTCAPFANLHSFLTTAWQECATSCTNAHSRLKYAGVYVTITILSSMTLPLTTCILLLAQVAAPCIPVNKARMGWSNLSAGWPIHDCLFRATRRHRMGCPASACTPQVNSINMCSLWQHSLWLHSLCTRSISPLS